jgi:5-formyltetrahydrofolate cyclo-ligase
MRCHEFRVNNMSETLSTKAALRRDLLAYRQGITAEVREKWDAAICARLMAWHNAQQVQILGVYSPIRGEPNLRSAYVELGAGGVRLALPVVAGKHAPLDFIEWKPGDPMTKDEYGVAIPVAGTKLHPDALLIPCVGFNALRFRLGYGGGFYDRTLAASTGAPRPLAVGIAYAYALAAFNADPHDVVLDALITQAELIA